MQLPGIRVLVADLHRVITDTTTMILSHSGFSAFAAYDVDHAVRITSKNAIDVAFIELLIGETNAIDAAERILAAQRCTSISGRQENSCLG